MTAIFIALAPRLYPVAFQPAYSRGNLSRPRAAASMRRSSSLAGTHRPPWATKRLGRLDDVGWALGLSNDGRDGQFHQGPLLPVEDARHEVSVAIEAQDVEGGPHDAKGLAVAKLDHEVGHAHPCPGEACKAAASRIPQHLIERGVRQTMQSVVLIDQEDAAGQSHHGSPGEPGRGAGRLARPTPGSACRCNPVQSGSGMGEKPVVTAVGDEQSPHPLTTGPAVARGSTAA